MENQIATNPMPVAPQLTEAEINIPYNEKISRLFLFRPLWMVLEIWVIYGWLLWIAVITFLTFFYQLFLGKRPAGMQNRRVRFLRHLIKWQTYLMWLTDKRPKFIED